MRPGPTTATLGRAIAQPRLQLVDRQPMQAEPLECATVGRVVDAVDDRRQAEERVRKRCGNTELPPERRPEREAAADVLLHVAMAEVDLLPPHRLRCHALLCEDAVERLPAPRVEVGERPVVPR